MPQINYHHRRELTFLFHFHLGTTPQRTTCKFAQLCFFLFTLRLIRRHSSHPKPVLVKLEMLYCACAIEKFSFVRMRRCCSVVVTRSEAGRPHRRCWQCCTLMADVACAFLSRRGKRNQPVERAHAFLAMIAVLCLSVGND